ncbi:oligosaccharide flippase family protein [Virgibacillus halodenitrificans]|uniref:O-unit flippase-like protein n=1 Tax=Virgibacillus halodenitrificans TaxID=1482 RepID=UPI001FB42A9F|nr:O-unit flippase-like protein [Virgibacillus halodenitrificans]MCJ0929718.1 oligosaccharide flippase family protein [Virgibacillus halodenitrificans]
MNIGKRDVWWGYISLLLVQGVNALLLPFVLIYLNDKELGLWYTFTSIYGLAILVDFGFQATISRNISYIWSGAENIKASGYNYSNNNNNEINFDFLIKLLSSIKSIYYLMGGLILIILLTVGTSYIYLITKNELNVSMVLFSWFFYLFAIVLNIMFSFWNSILKGIGAIKEYNKTLIIAKISQIILSLLLLYLGYGIVGLTFAYLLSVIINRVTLSRFFYNYSMITKSLRGKIYAKVNKDIIKSLIPNTVKTGLTSISNYLVINFPILLASYFLSLEISGEFGLVNQIITLCLTLSNSYFNTYLAKFNYFRVKDNTRALISLFKKSILINYAINLGLFLGVVLVGQFLLNLFDTGKSLLPNSLIVLIMLYRFLYNNQTLFVSLLSTKNIIPYYKSFLVSSIIIVSIQLITLSIHASIISIIIPIIVIQLFYNNWYWPYHVIKDLRR